jgi:hypothetical protein
LVGPCHETRLALRSQSLEILDELRELHEEIVLRCCDWLLSVTTGEGEVPLVLATARDASTKGRSTEWDPMMRCRFFGCLESTFERERATAAFDALMSRSARVGWHKLARQQLNSCGGRFYRCEIQRKIRPPNGLQLAFDCA